MGDSAAGPPIGGPGARAMGGSELFDTQGGTTLKCNREPPCLMSGLRTDGNGGIEKIIII